MRSFECKKILFDLDGVLVDSTPAVINAWHRWAEERGMEPDRILDVAHGRRTVETIQIVAPGLDAEAEAHELESMEVENLEDVHQVEGARELLASIPEDKWAVVTSGTRTLATRRMEHMRLPIPDILVSAEDVSTGKPDPEAYLKGARLAGVSPEECLVVEDAPSGISAGKAAGMMVVAVATTHRDDELADADTVTKSLSSLHVSLENESGLPNEPGQDRLRVWVEQ